MSWRSKVHSLHWLYREAHQEKYLQRPRHVVRISGREAIVARSWTIMIQPKTERLTLKLGTYLANVKCFLFFFCLHTLTHPNKNLTVCIKYHCIFGQQIILWKIENFSNLCTSELSEFFEKTRLLEHDQFGSNQYSNIPPASLTNGDDVIAIGAKKNDNKTLGSL